jgi:hypothetical protein
LEGEEERTGCSWVKSLLNQLIFLNIQDCVLTVYATYKERHLSLPSELKFADFSEFSEGEVERLRCSQAKPSLNPSIIFGIKACIFTISILYDMRGSRSRIEWEITNLSHYSKGKEGKLEVQMSQIFIESLDSFPN